MSIQRYKSGLLQGDLLRLSLTRNKVSKVDYGVVEVMNGTCSTHHRLYGPVDHCLDWNLASSSQTVLTFMEAKKLVYRP